MCVRRSASSLPHLITSSLHHRTTSSPTPIMKRTIHLFIFLLALAVGVAHAQERHSPFVPSEQANVERMLRLAELRDDDVVLDLGSGDGRIVFTAARMNPKLRGWGV